ncbi:hypothetical protein NG791_21095 [Laspinema sp. D1]|uniref:hypothetical protein n=1 Tax=Laspinema palackyanum TaxID=3231601 RepID=UPI0034772DFC|nr:hypothetical protein [Laspinema sp. D2b]
MKSYNFQIFDKFLPPPTEIRNEDQSTQGVGATWKLRRMVQVPYPEPSYSFSEHTVTERLLRVVKVPYPQPEYPLPDASARDPLEPTRESCPRWDPVVTRWNSHHRTIGSNWSEPLSGSTVAIASSRIQRDPSTHKRAIANSPFSTPG